MTASLPDISDDFKPTYLSMCSRLRVAPLHLLGVAANESGMRAEAHNPDGHASGWWQLMPDTARGLGWDPADCEGIAPLTPLARFRGLTATGQLPWFERYFARYVGRLVSRAACYVATFLPADLDLAADPRAVLVDKSEANPGEWRRGWAYASNASFDANHDLKIQVHELEDAIVRNARGPRWDAMCALLGEAPVPATVRPGYDLGTTWGQEQALKALGYYAGAIDGFPGPLLRGATAAFQRQAGLEQVGYFGPRTRLAVATALAGLLP